MARIEVDYEGDVLTLRGWLPGEAALNVPRGGAVEMYLGEDDNVCLVCRDRHGSVRPMRVEAEQG